MGVKETPISENPEAETQEEAKEEAKEEKEEAAKDKEEKEEESQIVAKKKTRAKPKQEKAAKPAKAKPAAKPAKTEDPKTMCHVCTTEMTNDALLSHSCSKKALETRKKAPVFEEAPPPPPLERQPLSYREIVAQQQAEYRRQKAARIVNPIRAHFFGRI